MTATAMVFLCVVWGIIVWGTGFCFYRLLTSDREFGSEEERPQD